MNRRTKLVRVFEVERKQGFVFDNFLAPEDAGDLLTLARAGLPAVKGSKPKGNIQETQHSGIEMKPKLFRTLGLFEKLRAQIEGVYPFTVEDVHRIYTTESRYGENALIHADGWVGKKGPGITALIFLNSDWEDEWAGEITFFDNNRDAVTCVTPKPGRLVLSRSEINHRAGIPSRLFFGIRKTLVIMFSVKADDPQSLKSAA